MYGYIRVLAAVACVGVVAGFAAGGRGAGAAALGTAEADARVGGACANTKCGAEECTTTGCDTRIAICTKERITVDDGNQIFKVDVCRRVGTTAGMRCNSPPGSNAGFNCSDTTGNRQCGEIYQGAPDPQTLGCRNPNLPDDPTRCSPTGRYCGSVLHTCSETSCNSGK